MADPELVEILKQGSDVWNRWREQQPQNVRIDLSEAHLRGIDLSGANLQKAIFIETNLQEAKLVEANLHEADLQKANLREANLMQANLQDANCVATNLSLANLSGANFSRADLSRAYLKGAYLDRACLGNAFLHYTNLSESNLNEADLNNADLRHTDLSDADLSHANLYNAHLQQACLTRAILYRTNLSNISFSQTILAYNDLRQARGLVTVHHYGPSVIDLPTVQLSPDGSALHFLRGAGVPDEWIDDYRSHMMNPIQYHSCFISYAHQDDDLAYRLHADLQDRGVRCWFAPHDMRIGDKIRPRIDEAIHLQDKLLLILSEEAVNSDWVEHEVETALAKEHREKRTILFPIRLDNAILERPYTGWAATVQNERHIGDFTGWKDHDHYQVAFERLIRDLKKADEKNA